MYIALPNDPALSLQLDPVDMSLALQGSRDYRNGTPNNRESRAAYWAGYDAAYLAEDAELKAEHAARFDYCKPSAAERRH
ncbi:MAG: hypothetical protein KAI80_06760 [Hyphomicrobiaceae bacterium]|nr:hypothetical protein [Hyphomicrobiaceae bacterium]